MSANTDRLNQADLIEMVLRLSHTIRNPLTSIKAVIQLVDHLSTDNDDITSYLGSALLEVDRIDSIVRDMQRLVRLDSHTAVTVEVLDAARHSMAEVATEAERRGVSVVLGEHDDSVVLVDPDQLGRVIAELLDNAVSFSGTGTTVTIGWRPIEGGWVELFVDDQGPGIPEHEAERILRPFYSTQTRGTGLGLNIVERFCALQGGRLKWVNRAQGGCRFTLNLCRVPPFES